MERADLRGNATSHDLYDRFPVDPGRFGEPVDRHALLPPDARGLDAKGVEGRVRGQACFHIPVGALIAQ